MTIQERLQVIRTAKKRPESIDYGSYTAKKLEQEQTEIKNAIAKIQDPVLAELLTKYYIDGKTMEEVAYDIGYSPRHISRLHKKALEEISKYII